jgi:hypothetical protein
MSAYTLLHLQEAFSRDPAVTVAILRNSNAGLRANSTFIS